MYPNKAYRLVNYLDELDNTMWTELGYAGSISLYRRNLQRYYVERLIDLATPKSGWDNRDVGPVTKNKLNDIRLRIEKALLKNKGCNDCLSPQIHIGQIATSGANTLQVA